MIYLYRSSITLLILVLFFLLGCSYSPQLSQKKLAQLFPPENTLIEYHTDWTKNHYKERIRAFKEAPLSFGDIVFIGNSITEGGNDWGAKFGDSKVKNRGISGDVTDGVLKRLEEIAYFKPKAVFLLIGINDLFNLHHQKQIPSPEYVGENILKIAEALHRKSPKTQIHIQTILPTSKAYMKEYISTVNRMIQANEKGSHYKVIDLHSAFINEKGLLKKELTYDGTHLSEKGYGVWVEKVKALVVSK